MELPPLTGPTIRQVDLLERWNMRLLTLRRICADGILKPIPGGRKNGVLYSTNAVNELEYMRTWKRVPWVIEDWCQTFSVSDTVVTRMIKKCSAGSGPFRLYRCDGNQLHQLVVNPNEYGRAKGLMKVEMKNAIEDFEKAEQKRREAGAKRALAMAQRVFDRQTGKGLEQ